MAFLQIRGTNTSLVDKVDANTVEIYVKSLVDMNILHHKFLQILQEYATLEQIMQQTQKETSTNYYQAAENIVKNLNIERTAEIQDILQQYADQEKLFDKPSFVSSLTNNTTLDNLQSIHSKFFIALCFANLTTNDIFREARKEQGTDYYQAAKNIVTRLGLTEEGMRTQLFNRWESRNDYNNIQTLEKCFGAANTATRKRIFNQSKEMGMNTEMQVQDIAKMFEDQNRIKGVLNLYKDIQNGSLETSLVQPFGQSFEDTMTNQIYKVSKYTQKTPDITPINGTRISEKTYKLLIMGGIALLGAVALYSLLKQKDE